MPQKLISSHPAFMTSHTTLLSSSIRSRVYPPSVTSPSLPVLFRIRLGLRRNGMSLSNRITLAKPDLVKGLNPIKSDLESNTTLFCFYLILLSSFTLLWRCLRLWILLVRVFVCLLLFVCWLCRKREVVKLLLLLFY